VRHVRNRLEASYTILALTGGVLGLHLRAIRNDWQALTAKPL